MYKTENPVPSSALEDMADNAQVFDGLVTKTSGTVTDRLGNVRRSFQQVIMDMGFNPVSGSFQSGATITEYNQCLLDSSTGTFYSWNGALPKVVPVGSKPSTAGGIGAGAWVDRTDLTLRGELESGGLSIEDIANFKGSFGAENVGVDLFYAYSIGTIGSRLVPVPGADNTGATDCTSAFNSKIQSMALEGGGVLKPIAGTYLIKGSVLLPSNIYLDLRGVTLLGSGANILIKSAALISSVLTDITSEHGTSSQGAGTNYVRNSGIIGGSLGNAALGVRGHRLNYGAHLYGTMYMNTLAQSYYTTHCWGLKVEQNTIYAPAVMSDFVDWTEVCGNSFEGPGSTVTAYALTLDGSYGGSYSAFIHSNGFHHWTHGLVVNSETTNLRIESNHFEDTVYHISGNTYTKRGTQIHSNWFKANLMIPASTVIGITFTNFYDGRIGVNRFTTDGSSAFSGKIVLSSSGCIGNTIEIEYSPSNSATPDWTGYQINAANTVNFRCGSNESSVTQPAVLPMAGSSGYTIEQYKRVYHAVANTIPYCSVTYSGTTVTITTQISAGTYGSPKLAKYNFMIVGTTTYVLAGMVCMLDITSFCNRELFSNAAGIAVITASVSGGYLVLTITGAPSGGYITGWIKEE